jgi:major membrane immunogen (membrane-anchored lipoprotein)
MKLKLTLLLILSLLIFSCSSKTKSDSKNNDIPNSLITADDISNENNDSETTTETNTSSSDCGLDDGTYSATVGYNNPETGYSATYTLDVNVEDCQVAQRNFPNDGYLGLDHISAANIDENGNASVDGENGKTYEIQIDN